MNLNNNIKNECDLFSKFAISKSIDELTRWELYSSLMNIVIHTSPEHFVEFRTNIEVLTEYMLRSRYIQSSPKLKTLRKRDSEGNPITEPVDTELVRYDGFTEKKPKLIHPDPLHIVKFFKGLETLLLSGQNNIKFEELSLGSFADLCKSIADSLTKLLLSVRVLEDTDRKWAYTKLFSLIVIYRQFKVKSRPDTSTLTNPYNGDPDSLVDSMFTEDSMKSFLNRLFTQEDLKKEVTIKFYSGNASSPNSLSASTKIFEDAWAVKSDKRLKEAILSLARHFNGGREFIYFVETLFLNLSDLGKTIHSRLFHFTAPGGKARIIANADWLSQTALSGLHYYFYYLLSKLPQDQTFDHKAGLGKIFAEKANFYSVDLSAATDRIPKRLQQRLIKVLFDVRGMDGEEISKNWFDIMDREYEVGDAPLNNGLPVRYAVGQGMGLFTSWSIMALLHHYIVSELCKVHSDDYILVGDDLVIRGKRESFDRYISVMTSIGVEVNLSKTLVSEGDRPTIEFARNYIIDGCKVVPAQYGILFAWLDDKTSLDSLLFNSDWADHKTAFFRFLVTFKKFLSLKKLGYLIICNRKSKLKYLNCDSLSVVFKLPRWFVNIKFDRIIDICRQLDVAKKDRLILEDLSPISTLASQVVVRTTRELQDVISMSHKLALLAFVDDEISKIATKWHDRLNNVQLIQYDVSYFGSPLISKREQNMLNKVIDREIKRQNKKDSN